MFYCEVCFIDIQSGKFCSDSCSVKANTLARQFCPTDWDIESRFNGAKAHTSKRWVNTARGKEKQRAAQRRFGKTPKARHLWHKRRARKLKATWDDSAKHFILGKQCIVCGASKNLTVDHIIPLAKGGGHVYNNLTTLCKSCNSSKGTMDMKSFLIKRSNK